MIIEHYFCHGCGREHERRVYESKAEMATVIFMKEFFPQLWEKLKQKANEVPVEDFCKKLVEAALYTYLKNSRRIRKSKDDIIDAEYTPPAGALKKE
ncbi:MAG: hypothetical protein NTY48_04890 [Candidatus Diapherotrites archaeon]|nr:hypothetical protein [Candidatus Diapherotrites archaeon]